MSKAEWETLCKDMRRDCLIMADSAGSAGLHFGGSLSLIEIIAALYFGVMNINGDALDDEARDRLILSKGHGVPAIYAALHQMGVLSDQDLSLFKADETELFGHPCVNSKLGIEFSSGSLGQGLSQGVGCALALKYKGNYNSRVFVILGDGECDEGSVWEAAMAASKFKLNNLIAIVDENKIQYDGKTEDIMPLTSLEKKWKSFGWMVKTIDGHDVYECQTAFNDQHDSPMVVIAQTIKGKGITFMENDPHWHHAKLTKSQRQQAWEELEDDRV